MSAATGLPTRTKSDSTTKGAVTNLTATPSAIEIRSNQPAPPRRLLPTPLTLKTSGLTKSRLALLLTKQKRLRALNLQTNLDSPALARSAAATLVFGQEEAGTAVCISPQGLLLTCSHCVAESEDELARSKRQWLLFESGQVVQAECMVWDSIRDLALLQIIAVQPQSDANESQLAPATYPFIEIADAPPAIRKALICIGQPGSEDLEAEPWGVKTDYDVLHVSSGRFWGHAAGQDLQDNSEIGALKHDCWTYWGHSGAPLLNKATGSLAGLHSSWDEETGMRRGVALEAVKGFLGEHTSFMPTQQEKSSTKHVG